ncbi:hypothetical protein BH24ACT5_BH24ACT5_11860 [soil metagenome]
MEFDDEVAALFDRPAEEGTTFALVVHQGGEVVVERYGERPGDLFEPEPAPVRAETPLLSWSVAKSMVHAVVGILVRDGWLDPARPAAVPGWAGTDRAEITALDLLEMRAGLRVVDAPPDVGHADLAALAATQPLEHRPGATWEYSSGATDIVCRILGDVVGGGEQGMRELLEQRLFGPMGMASADPRFDGAGTWLGSKMVYATARDYARFGELYLREGTIGGERILPDGWVDHGRTVVAHDRDSGFDYGRHWWVWPDQPRSIAAHGREGQYVIVLPERDVVIAHFGRTDATGGDRLLDRLRRVVAAL